ncbi:MAG: hypothetical protein DRJ40_06100 [Thermoprotei archaeon]|nr:MAG: hypothetical protein DRJ40_06100 [Thermoprotei archaeon]
MLSLLARELLEELSVEVLDVELEETRGYLAITYLLELSEGVAVPISEFHTTDFWVLIVPLNLLGLVASYLVLRSRLSEISDFSLIAIVVSGLYVEFIFVRCSGFAVYPAKSLLSL